MRDVAPPKLLPTDNTFFYKFRPLTDIQPADRPPRWTWWRAVAVCVAVGIMWWAWSDAVFSSAGRIQSWFTGTPAPPRSSRTPLELLVESPAAGLVLALMVAVAGRRAAGLRRRAPGELALAAGYALRGPYLAHTIMGTIGTLVIFAVFGAPSEFGTDVSWADALGWIHAGFVEEVLLTVLVYWLLEQVTTRSGTPVAHTAIGTSVIVGLWLFLHAHFEVFIWVMVPIFYLKVILWRHSKDLLVLVGFHIGWDTMENVPTQSTLRDILLVLALKLLIVYFGVIWEMWGVRAAENAGAVPAAAGTPGNGNPPGDGGAATP
jgi:hypothetical protein